MKREYVDSSMAKSVGYDLETLILEIEFRSGGIWQYYDVPGYVYDDMLQSGSIGKFFQANIKGVYAEAQIQ